MENPTISPLKFGVARIKDTHFALYEERLSPDLSKNIKIEFQNTFGFNPDTNVLILTLRVYFHYEDQPPEVTLVDTSVQNVFVVENLKSFLSDDNSLDLPTDLLKTLVSLTVSHTRAITSRNLAGTPLQCLFVPIVNLNDVTSIFSRLTLKRWLR